MALSRPDAGWQKLIERCVLGVAESLVTDPASSDASSERKATAAALAAKAGAALGQYLDLVLQWNARVDLTAARDNHELVDLFLADAALLALTLGTSASGAAVQAGQASASAEHWVDVGTGAGAPGLPLKLLRPELALELVEPKTKRVTFLRTVTSTLAMTGVEIRRQRAEEVQGQGFDVALSRATFSPEIWLAEGARIGRRAVWVLLAQAEAPSLVDWRVELSAQYRWPLSGVSRRALRFVRAE